MHMLKMLLSLLLIAPAMAAPRVLNYEETLSPIEDGLALVEAKITLSSDRAALRLPLPHDAEVLALSARDAHGLRLARMERVEGEPIIIIEPTAAVAPSLLPALLDGLVALPVITLEYRAKGLLPFKEAPHDTRRYTRRAVNTTRTTFGVYTLRVELPEGQRVHKIEATSPAVSVKNPNKPYAVVHAGGRFVVEMRCQGLRIGDVCAITYVTVGADRSWLPLLIGLLLGALYLIFYRHVLRET